MAKSVFGTPPSYVAVNYRPHAGQEEISEVLRKNFVLPTAAAVVEIIASRGWGKTLYLVCEVLVPFLNTHPNAKVMWVAPTYNAALAPIDDVFRGTNEETGERWVPETDGDGNKVWEYTGGSGASSPTLRWYNGATVSFKSAENPDSIVSRGYNLIIIDEAAMVQERVFTQQIMGTARKRGIKIFMISSPRGKKHWTYKYFLKGQDQKDTKYLSFAQPYTKNPHFSPILKELIKDIPDWMYRQEYLAEFIDDGDSVFKNVEACLRDMPELQFEGNQQEWSIPIAAIEVKDFHGVAMAKKPEDRRFIVSMDLAKSKDFTVITGMDLETGEIVYYRRMNKTDYRDVVKECVKVCAMLNGATLIYDATGVGAGVGDFLKNEDVIAHPYTFTNDSKADLINRLIISIEYEEISLPNIKTLTNEFAAFTYELTRTGKISYNAPSGLHDDIVISVAMANWFRKEDSGMDEAVVLEEILKINSGKKLPEERLSRLQQQMQDDND